MLINTVKTCEPFPLTFCLLSEHFIVIFKKSLPATPNLYITCFVYNLLVYICVSISDPKGYAHTEKGQLQGPFPTASHRWSWQGCSLAEMSTQWGYHTDGLINGTPFSAPGAGTSLV